MRRSTLAMLFLAHTTGCSLVVKPGAEPSSGIGPGVSTTFQVRRTFVLEIPEATGELRAWFPIPSPNDQYQAITEWRVESPYETRVVEDQRGNSFLALTAASPDPGPLRVATTFRLTRSEVRAELDETATRPHTQAEQAELTQWLKPTAMSVIDDDIKRMAADAVGMEPNPIVTARLLYRAVIDRVERDLKDPQPNATKTLAASGTGSSQACYASGTGDSADFHSLYAACARSIGLPVRTVYGAILTSSLDGTEVEQSDHCWIEFHAPNLGWIPLDAALADLFVEFEANEHNRRRADLNAADGYQGPDPTLVEYYFGHLEDRRISWHWGRDLVLGQQAPPLLSNQAGYAEADGEPVRVASRLTYTEER